MVWDAAFEFYYQLLEKKWENEDEQTSEELTCSDDVNDHQLKDVLVGEQSADNLCLDGPEFGFI